MYICLSVDVVVESRRRNTRCFFFFQAEDGIRDLVRYRGLGDVYKEQYVRTYVRAYVRYVTYVRTDVRTYVRTYVCTYAVPYTHLTLPTNREVYISVVAVSVTNLIIYPW